MKRAPARKATDASVSARARERRVADWRTENGKAIDAYREYFERHGIWNADERPSEPSIFC